MPITAEEIAALAQDYAKFGAPRPVVMKFAKVFFTAPVLEALPKIITLIDKKIRRFAMDTDQHASLIRLGNADAPTIHTLARFGFLPDNVNKPIINHYMAGYKQAEPILHKPIDTITLSDIQQLPFTNDNRIEVAVSLMVAQTFRKLAFHASAGSKHKAQRPTSAKISTPRAFTIRNQLEP